MLDTQGMWDAAAQLPEQVAAAARRTGDIAGLPRRDAIAHVVVLGMGGSGIAGDVFEATAGPDLEVPVSVVKSYCPPGFVGPSRRARGRIDSDHHPDKRGGCAGPNRLDHAAVPQGTGHVL